MLPHRILSSPLVMPLVIDTGLDLKECITAAGG